MKGQRGATHTVSLLNSISQTEYASFAILASK